jgi:hypothetical protein
LLLRQLSGPHSVHKRGQFFYGLGDHRFIWWPQLLSQLIE